MAGMDDILTAAKNIVSAINGQSTTTLSIAGLASIPSITASTVVSSKGGRIINVSVTVAGSTTGTIYDSNLLINAVRPIYIIPSAIGLYNVNLPVSYGILVTPGTGQTLTVSYS